jgi:hypothetical protein
MASCRLGRVLATMTVALSTSVLALVAGQPAGASGQSGAGDCIAHHPTASSEYAIKYAGGCSGHDEPELDPVSSLPGSARDLTWTAVLPKDGTVLCVPKTSSTSCDQAIFVNQATDTSLL